MRGVVPSGGSQPWPQSADPGWLLLADLAQRGVTLADRAVQSLVQGLPGRSTPPAGPIEGDDDHRIMGLNHPNLTTMAPYEIPYRSGEDVLGDLGKDRVLVAGELPLLSLGNRRGERAADLLPL